MQFCRYHALPVRIRKTMQQVKVDERWFWKSRNSVLQGIILYVRYVIMIRVRKKYTLEFQIGKIRYFQFCKFDLNLYLCVFGTRFFYDATRPQLRKYFLLLSTMKFGNACINCTSITIYISCFISYLSC